MPQRKTTYFLHTPQFDSALSGAQKQSWQADADRLAGAGMPDKTRDQLAAILATSPHLNRAAVRFSADLPALMNGDWQNVLAAARTDWQMMCRSAASDKHLMRDIRTFRNRTHFAIALAELLGHTDISESWSLLTRAAEEAVQGVVCYLLKDQKADSSGWVILGLGKLGAGELNYSSDIDLIALYHSPDSTGPDEQAATKKNRYFNELTRRLSTLLSQQTEDGFGWRVDFRLRPDPAVTPLCLSADAAISYYESIARSWERAAFIRARPIAGDKAEGERFLQQISPFIWRRNLDYTVLDDLQVWLRHLPTPADYLGFDVKLGAFGIRHIELLVHLLQLLGGGRHQALRQHHTFDALDALATEGWLSSEQIKTMKLCYSQWRLIEHRLQYLRDTQTHSLPRNEAEMNSFACFTGHNDSADLRQMLADLQKQTEAACSHPLMDRLLAGHNAKASAEDRRLASSADRTVNSSWLAEVGFSRPDDMMDIIDGWMSGRVPATRSERARDYLTRFLPSFLMRLGKADAPDSAFACFTELIRNLPAGAQIFALFVHYPQLADLVGSLLVKAPEMTNTLSRKPALFDLLLETSFFTPFSADPLTVPFNLQQTVTDSGAEQALGQLCLWAGEARFRTDVHFLQGLCRVDEASRRLSAIADICIREVTRMARLDMHRRYGALPDERFAVLGLGRLGSQRLTPNSDLDLMFVYDSQPDAMSDGRQKLTAGQYYNRMAQLIISWLSVRTAQGKLFDIDARLRPDGQSGALATYLGRLTDYYQTQAWPWEYCAFLKTRLIYADEAVKEPCETAVQSIKTTPPSWDDLSADIITMRHRLAQDTGTSLSLKKRPGGFLDAEFLGILTAVKANKPHLLTDPDGNPSALIKLLSEQGPDNTELAAVFAGLNQLEMIAQFSSLCLGGAAIAPSETENQQTWLALADRLGVQTVQDIDRLITDRCALTHTVLEKILQKNAPEQD